MVPIVFQGSKETVQEVIRGPVVVGVSLVVGAYENLVEPQLDVTEDDAGVELVVEAEGVAEESVVEVVDVTL